jgi:hypothetical protein
VFALLVPSVLTSCQRLVDNVLQGCWAQQTCYKLFQQLVIVLQFNNLSTSCEWQPCMITSLLSSTISEPVVNKLLEQHCYKSDAGLLHTQKSDNLSTRCVRNRLVASLSTSCNDAVILSSCSHPTYLFFVCNHFSSKWRAIKQLVDDFSPIRMVVARKTER